MCFSAREHTRHAVVRICVWSAVMKSCLFHPERRHSRGRKCSEAKYFSLYAQYFLPGLTTARVGSTQRRRTKRLKWIYSLPDGGWMCRRWSDDNLCSLLKWNMTARELSAISCLAQEAPIWSWVLSVLCCCVAGCYNSFCHCWCCFSMLLLFLKHHAGQLREMGEEEM